MMPQISQTILAVSSSPAASILVKATITTALGLIGARLARRGRAAVRHALLAAAFGLLLVLPVASIVAPPLRIAVPITERGRTVPPPVRIGAASHTISADSGIRGVPVVSRSVWLSPSVLLLAAWILGAMLFLLPIAVGLRQVRSLRRSSLPWQHGQLLVDSLAIDAGIHRPVEALLHETLPGPMTCGLLHPAIVLPLDAQNWDAEELSRAMVHELEHVRRHDWVTHCIARAVCAAYWFHPLVWIAWRQLALEAERSCDDAVLGHSEATAYADQLVGVARRLALASSSAAAKSPLLAMANRVDLTTRVRAVLDSRQRRGRAGVFPVALTCAVAAALVVTVSPLKVVAAQQSASAVTPAAQFAINGNLVIEDVTVCDPNGKAIEGLSANDFVVTEDGVAQTISIFEFQKLASAVKGVQNAVLSYYILGYYTTNQSIDDKFRKLKVSLKGDSTARLDYRPGYYAWKFTRYGQSLPGQGVDSVIGLDPNAPVVLSRKSPEYSEEARKAKYQGTVMLNVEVSASGEVTNVSVIRRLGLGLDEKAIEAVKQWKFKPVIKDGKPVAVQTQVGVSFRLL